MSDVDISAGTVERLAASCADLSDGRVRYEMAAYHVDGELADAAATLRALRAALDAAEKDNANLSQQALALLSERDAAQARADAAEHALNMERARVHECRTIQREMARDIQTLQPPAELAAQAAQAPGDAVAQEREACAQIAFDHWMHKRVGISDAREMGARIEAAIRARAGA